MSDKYYTPEINEFHVGFEYEVLDIAPNLKGKEFRFDSIDSVAYLKEVEKWLKDGDIRVKYLDVDDIIECEFEQLHGGGLPLFKKDLYEVVQSFNNMIRIQHNKNTIFMGSVKNKSELKRILKQVRITK